MSVPRVRRSLVHAPALQQGTGAAAAVTNTGHAAMSEWLFQMVFMASAASIVSGTLAERVKLWSFFVSIVVLTAFIYPVIGAWTWGGGWLAAMGFQDFAGSRVAARTSPSSTSRHIPSSCWPRTTANCPCSDPIRRQIPAA